MMTFTIGEALLTLARKILALPLFPTLLLFSATLYITRRYDYRKWLLQQEKRLPAAIDSAAEVLQKVVTWLKQVAAEWEQSVRHRQPVLGRRISDGGWNKLEDESEEYSDAEGECRSDINPALFDGIEEGQHLIQQEDEGEAEGENSPLLSPTLADMEQQQQQIEKSPDTFFLPHFQHSSIRSSMKSSPWSFGFSSSPPRGPRDAPRSKKPHRSPEEAKIHSSPHPLPPVPEHNFSISTYDSSNRDSQRSSRKHNAELCGRCDSPSNLITARDSGFGFSDQDFNGDTQYLASALPPRSPELQLNTAILSWSLPSTPPSATAPTPEHVGSPGETLPFRMLMERLSSPAGQCHERNCESAASLLGGTAEWVGKQGYEHEREHEDKTAKLDVLKIRKDTLRAQKNHKGKATKGMMPPAESRKSTNCKLSVGDGGAEEEEESDGEEAHGYMQTRKRRTVTEPFFYRKRAGTAGQTGMVVDCARNADSDCAPYLESAGSDESSTWCQDVFL